MVIGYLLTLIFLVFWGAVALTETQPTSACTTGLCRFWNSSPNEIGDTFAGLFGSLAFVWIIVTVLLQGRELAAQREELKLTRLEMEEQRAATQEIAKANAKQVEISELQAEIYRDERDQRQQAYSSSQANELFAHSRELLVELFVTPCKFSTTLGETTEVRLLDHLPVNLSRGSELHELPPKILFSSLMQALSSLMPSEGDAYGVEPPGKLIRFHKHLSEVATLAQSAGIVTKAKYEDEGLFETLRYLDATFGAVS